MNIAFACAASLGALWTGVHVFAGGRTVADPLLAAEDLKPVPKFTQYYCWHLVTLTLALMAVGFGIAAIADPGRMLGAFLTAMAAAFAVWGIVLAPIKGQSYGQMPQGWLFVPVAVAGLIGLMT